MSEPATAPVPSVRRPERKRRVKTPTVLQMEAVECGAAALGIVLEYYGLVVPIEQLRVECGVSRDGSKASNMVRAARRFGMVAGGYRYDMGQLLELRLPCVLFWQFNHFVVLEGFGPDRVYLNDPAVGPRTVSYEHFDESFTGVVLTFHPGPDFQKGGKRPSIYGALKRRVQHSEWALLYTFLVGLALVIPGLLFPVFAGIFVDKILVAGLDDWFRPLIVAMLITAVVQTGLVSLQQYFLLRLETKVAVASSSRFLWHVLRLPVEFYTQRYGGEISSRVRLNDEVARFVGKRLVGTAIDALLIVFYAALMFTYDWSLTAIGIAAVLLNADVTRRVNRAREDGNRRLLQEQGKATGALIGGLASIETMKASGSEPDLFGRWAGYHAKFVNAHQQLGTITQLFLAVPTVLSSLTAAAVLGLGAWRVMQGELSIGQLVAFQTLMTGFLTPVENMAKLAGEIQEMKGNMGRLDDVMRYAPDPQTSLEQVEPVEAPAVVRVSAANPATSTADDQVATRLIGNLEFRDVTFGYSRFEAPLLTELSFTVRPGERVALVGPSGCGKSTVAKLATALYQPWSGDILLDDARRAQIPFRVLRNSVAMVDQEIVLFEGTVRENLTLWDPTVPDSVLIRAAKDACIHDDIAARQGGYDSKIEEGGANLSGGQRQRLEIARALVTNPRILILDEATSALDAVTEQLIDQSLRQRGCTCVIIAHRLSTIRDADEIIVLNRGEVVQRGTHSELIKRVDGTYARLAREA